MCIRDRDYTYDRIKNQVVVVEIKKKSKEIKIPSHALTNNELFSYAKLLNVSNFRGVFMKDNLP